VNRGRSWWLVAGLCALVAAAFWARALLRSPANTDELIYLVLARSILEGGAYSLRGSALMEALPTAMYDHAIFNHPPGFPILLGALARLGLAPVFASYLAALACATAVFVVVRGYLWKDARTPLAGLLGLLAVMVCVFDPVLAFCVRRVWMDATLAAMVAWSFAGVLLFRRNGRIVWLVVAALALAAAVGTKLLAVVFAIPLVTAAVLAVPAGKRALTAAGILLPAFGVIVAWELTFFRATGVWWPDWLRIPAEAAAANPFLASRLTEGPLFFLHRWPTFAPAAVAALVFGVWSAWTRQNRDSAILVFGVVVYLAVLVGLGAAGISRETRYLSPLGPLAAMMVAVGARDLPGRRQALVAAAIIGLALTASARVADFYLANPLPDEPHPAGAIRSSRGENKTSNRERTPPQ